MDADNYRSPLSERYASAAMRFNFSDQRKFTTWRALWIALAECERELGLAISAEQVAELKAHATDLDLEAAARFEQELRHDVMAQIHAWGEQCPKARPIIHLGATSCFVTDNSELLAMREGLRLLRRQLVSAIAVLRDFALQWKDLPTLGFTHYQPAQATTVGKRATLNRGADALTHSASQGACGGPPPIIIGAKFSKRVNLPMKLRFFVPIGPLRCLPMMISAMPLNCSFSGS